MSGAITIRIGFRLQRDELIAALCFTQRSMEPGDVLPVWGPAKIREQVRDVVAKNGNERFCYWRDDLADGMTHETYVELEQQVTSWAAGCVDRGWPEIAEADR